MGVALSEFYFHGGEKELKGRGKERKQFFKPRRQWRSERCDNKPTFPLLSSSFSTLGPSAFAPPTSGKATPALSRGKVSFRPVAAEVPSIPLKKRGRQSDKGGRGK